MRLQPTLAAALASLLVPIHAAPTKLRELSTRQTTDPTRNHIVCPAYPGGPYIAPTLGFRTFVDRFSEYDMTYDLNDMITGFVTVLDTPVGPRQVCVTAQRQCPSCPGSVVLTGPQIRSMVHAAYNDCVGGGENIVYPHGVPTTTPFFQDFRVSKHNATVTAGAHPCVNFVGGPEGKTVFVRPKDGVVWPEIDGITSGRLLML